MSRFKVLTIIGLLLASMAATSDAGPFARWRAHRHERIASRINARQDRIETRRYGQIRSGAHAYGSGSAGSSAYGSGSSGSAAYSSGSSGSSAYQVVAVSGASSGSTAVLAAYSAPASQVTAPAPPEASQGSTEATDLPPSEEVEQWQPVSAPVLPAINSTPQQIIYRTIPNPVTHTPTQATCRWCASCGRYHCN